MTSPSRVASYHALRAISTNRIDLPAALAETRLRLTDERDRALAAEIITGTLRLQRRLDHVIARSASKPLSKLDPEVVTILRLSAYQILHLDRVPASAIVDDAVSLTRTARKPSASGFVNAVLRSTLRQRSTLTFPPRPEDPTDRVGALAYLGVTHSHPDWLIARWLDRYGLDAAEEWVRFNNQAADQVVRANRLRNTREALAEALARDDIETKPTQYAPDGLIVTVGNALRRPADGTFLAQDEASQLVSLAVGARPGERVLDLCASPGGKTTAMAADMRNEGSLVACDVRPKRIDLLRHTVRVSGATCVDVVHIPFEGPLPFGGAFDRVLVDAPCSGLGTIRRDPDIRWRRAEADLSGLASEQLRLLARVAHLVAPGGRLVYATCSSEPEENEAVVDAFCRDRRDFAPLHLGEASPAIPAELLDSRGMLRTQPSRHGLEAFFAAALVRV